VQLPQGRYWQRVPFPADRFGVFDAGIASARDPKYTGIPQRERLPARQNGHVPAVTT
jgi:hypothetical protein